jgi:hypothetical protein
MIAPDAVRTPSRPGVMLPHLFRAASLPVQCLNTLTFLLDWWLSQKSESVTSTAR